MAPPARRFRVRSRNCMGINFSPKAKALFKPESSMKGNTFDECISKFYPFIMWDSSQDTMEVHVWDDIFHIPADTYETFITMRYPHTFFRRELHKKAISRNNGNYLYAPLCNRRYRNSEQFIADFLPTLKPKTQQ